MRSFPQIVHASCSNNKNRKYRNFSKRMVQTNPKERNRPARQHSPNFWLPLVFFIFPYVCSYLVTPKRVFQLFSLVGHLPDISPPPPFNSPPQTCYKVTQAKRFNVGFYGLSSTYVKVKYCIRIDLESWLSHVSIYPTSE